LKYDIYITSCYKFIAFFHSNSSQSFLGGNDYKGIAVLKLGTSSQNYQGMKALRRILLTNL